MKHLGWITFALVAILATKSLVFKSVDQNSRDLASNIEIRLKNAEANSPIGGNESLRNLAELNQVVSQKLQK